MTPAPIHFAGERLMLDPAGALVWPEQGLVAVADLHLEKGSSLARRGMLLPPWDTKATLDRLVLLLRRWRPRTVIALGDSFHDADGCGRLPRGEAARLVSIIDALRWVWVQGNHDPGRPGLPGGDWTDVYAAGSLVFRHLAEARAAAGEISGHFHPKAMIPARGTWVSRPCFVADARRIVLPAFGAYTGGLDVGDPVIARLFPRGGRLFLLGRERLFSFAMGPMRS